MKTSSSLNLFSIYSRKDLQDLFKITDSTVNNGIFQPKGHSSVWLFVTKHKTPDRTDYKDDFNGQILNYEGQLKGRTDEKIINHSKEGNEILVFYRERKSEYPNYAFKYLGRFRYISHSGYQPRKFNLQAIDIPSEDTEEIEMVKEEFTEEEFIEGEEKTRIQTYYERNPNLRAEALKYHGTRCIACGFDFFEKYGEHGEGFIEIHHLYPLSSYEREVVVNPKTDLVPLCSNCHRMVHRKKLLSIEELKDIINSRF